ncbi:phosphatase inhibitor-domain-containing protein [Irpex rosettiformis]|uniref:Phosphatase inhibitor-domain-containing protein n=1 Tax=Irpex rosettiformis TaxID=378272 RepID=A0ACB8UB19_9APHY|nr:phosphatase inhibitor-domain-containing protein [Irpex rosettiformis]
MSYLATHPNTSAATDGSRTITILDSTPREEAAIASGNESEVGSLRLRGASRRDRAGRPRVVWREDVVDNEGAGKKSSKICCIYHKPRPYDESSSESSSSSSDSDSDSDSGCDSHSHPSSSRPHSHPKPRRQPPESRGEGGSNTQEGGSGAVHELHDPAADVNRYERQPKRKGALKGVNRNNWHTMSR